MRKLHIASLISSILFFGMLGAALERQPNSDYHARREALAEKTNGVIVLFAAMENDGPNDLYGFRQDDNFYYLSGLNAPGGALLIASASEAKGEPPARPFTEIQKRDGLWRIGGGMSCTVKADEFR